MVYTIISQRQLRHNQLAYRTPLPPKQSYDYIVVGAGSAGAIVSCRLSEWGWDVLLLEAGGPPDAILDDLPGSMTISDGSKWHFQFEPQKYIGHSFPNNGIQYDIMGRGLGGSSTVNSMSYNRGNRKYYDMIASKYGAIGWDYASVLPVFKQMENNTDPRLSDEYHGRQGPIVVSTWDPVLPIFEKQAQAAREWGLYYTDINGPNQTGFTIYQSTIRHGLRLSTNNVYLEGGLCPKLTIVTGAQVSKVIIKRMNPNDDNNQPPRAQGVEFIKYNRTYHVWTKREVIVSGGTIGSPQLLMLSGIGPAGHLQDTAGIREVYVDLPGVGENYCNHVEMFLDFPRPSSIDDDLIGPWPTLTNLTQLYQAIVLGTGPLAQRQNALMYWSSSQGGMVDRDYPDIYVVGTISPYFTSPTNTNDQQHLTLYVALVRPVSYGTVRLNSSRIEDQPLIDAKSLSDKFDRQRFREAISRAYRFAETTSLSEYISIPNEPIKNCQYCPNGPVYQCWTYIDCLIREWASVDAHPVGTCRMGDPQRRDTVVDPRLRVKGIRGLRVCDASVYPEIINANTNAGAMLAGEMGARFIHEDNQ
ncbi:L-sorbose 1-dehydrogenase-like [Oppia nitens]|uniref:L-sorbose 1-dehydrogenase-like n=1 Tax=Oppia nitens TaxID=1686743 RepID=UPI0023DC461B|nr:L-sorbose 1-dehydrogenase-like [Oppia nitens]